MYTIDVVADSIQFLEPRNSGGAPAPQYGGQVYGNNQSSIGSSTYQPSIYQANYSFKMILLQTVKDL